jgi:hypothetical protein
VDGIVAIHDSTFDANTATYVSGGVMVSRNVPDFSSPIPGGGHATSRVELLMLMAQMSRSTPAFSRATALSM